VRVVAAMALMAASAGLAGVQQPMSLADAELRGAAMFEQSGATGMVLVVVRDRDVLTTGYGETAPASGIRPGPISLVRLCSISKVFAGELLTETIGEGTLKGSDPLQKYAPRGKVVPSWTDGTPIRLVDLATHTSGLPREVSSYPRNTPHFTFPDEAYRWSWLPKQVLKTRPGTAALYSNIGFDLLGDALAAAAKMSYTELFNERIVAPLGLRDTTLTPSSEQCGRLLAGLRDQGPCTDTQASAASGGVYSTGVDMARVLQFWLEILPSAGTPAPVGPPITVSLKPAQLRSVQGLSHAGDPTGIGMAWIQLGDPESASAVVQKTGGGAGFQTYIALIPKRKAGIFFAVTDGVGGSVNLYKEANDFLAALANVPPLPVRVRPVTKRRSRGKS
jgi:serine-type D-Ala-D-Ala carboxypeptidase/endopeptidase